MTHIPVLLEEVVSMMQVRPDGRYIDGTVGGGGHAAALADRLRDGCLLGLDRDPEALARARRRLSGYGERVMLRQAAFADIAAAAGACGLERADGILLDIGVSSEQLDDPRRGFSFQSAGPLDMRMDPRSPLTAAEIVNRWSQERLAELIRRYGEERNARRIAAAIVRRRRDCPFRETLELAEFIAEVCPRRGPRHPATRTFQALRLAVNGELEQLEAALGAGLDLLAPGGRMVIISFHSLEDRIVKRFFSSHAGRRESLPAGGSRWIGADPPVLLLNRRVRRPSPEEIQRNPRSRSARLRGVERLPGKING